MIGYPLGDNLLIEILLLFGVLYDLYLQHTLTVSLPFAAGITTVTLLMQKVDHRLGNNRKESIEENNELY
jgi:hypothetical protein